MIVKKLILLTAAYTLIIFASGAYAGKTYTIRKGDTLSRIAKKFHVSVRAIEGANSIDAHHLKPGQKIVIPAGEEAARPAGNKQGNKTEAHIPEDSSKHNASETETAKSAESTTYHIIRKGDTLSSIAREYGISEADIKALNNLRTSRLKTGRKLLVRHVEARTYVVRKGDTISKIAGKFNIEPGELIGLNELSSPALIIGQKLYLEEKPESLNLEKKYVIMARDLEAELKRVSESPEFAEQTTQDKLVIFAKKLLNIPYKFGGTSIFGIDCSGYVKKVYGLLGVEIPRTAREQFKEGKEIEKENLSVGDLVFFRTYASFPSHVGIYLGNNLFIHASSKGKKVTIDSLEAPYYLKRFIGAKRLLSATEKLQDPAMGPSG
jgi:LysM repeat protein